MSDLDRMREKATWLLSRVQAHAGSLLADAFAAHGVRGYHFRLLAALDQFGPSSQADLGRHTGIDRSDVVATVNDLVGRGWAVRRPDPVDRRRNVVSMTKRGAVALERLDAVAGDVQAELLAPLRADERTMLMRLLTTLAERSD